MHNRSTRILLALACVAIVSHPRQADAQALDDAFRTDIYKLLEITRAAEMGTQAANVISAQFLDGMKQAQPDIPDRALTIVKQVFEAEFAKAFTGPDGITHQLVPLYAKHFTHDDIRGLLAFYGTDLGKKAIRVMPTVFNEAAAVGQEWAEKQMPRVLATVESRLRAEGFLH